MKRLVVIAVAVLAVPIVLWGGGAAGADEIVISIDGVVSGTPGQVVNITDQAVDADLVGATCNGVVQPVNNDSVHPNTNVIVSTGDVTATAFDVEGAAGKVTQLAGSVVLGTSIRVDLRISDDGVSSGGFALVLDCTPAPPPTTAAPTTTVAPPPTTTAAPPATTAAPPATTAAPAPTTTIATEVLGAVELPAQPVQPAQPAQPVGARPSFTG